MIRTLVLLPLLAAAPALAAPAATVPPAVLPRIDVTVTYRVSGAAADAIPTLSANGAPAELRLAWDAAHQKLLVTAPGRPQRLLADLPGHGATVLDDGMHAALFLPMRDTDVQALTMAHARFTRRGPATVAGEPCTDWAVQSDRSTGTVCLTTDGVPLRGDGDVNGRHGTFVATAVDRRPANPGDFAIPGGYTRLELPRFGGK